MTSNISHDVNIFVITFKYIMTWKSSSLRQNTSWRQKVRHYVKIRHDFKTIQYWYTEQCYSTLKSSWTDKHTDRQTDRQTASIQLFYNRFAAQLKRGGWHSSTNQKCTTPQVPGLCHITELIDIVHSWRSRLFSLIMGMSPRKNAASYLLYIIL